MQDLLSSMYFSHGIFYIDTSLKIAKTILKLCLIPGISMILLDQREKKKRFFCLWRERNLFHSIFTVPPPPAGKHGDAFDRFDHGPFRERQEILDSFTH